MRKLWINVRAENPTEVLGLHQSTVLASTRALQFRRRHRACDLPQFVLMLEFGLGNPKQRKASLAKIDRLLKVGNEFRDAVHREAELIEKQKPEKQF